MAVPPLPFLFILALLPLLLVPATLPAAPLDKFIDTNPANHAPEAKQFEVVECFQHPLKRQEVEGGLRIALITMERELKEEFIKVSGRRFLSSVSDINTNLVSFQFVAIDGEGRSWVEGKILSTRGNLQIWVQVRSCADRDCKVFKSAADAKESDQKRAKDAIETLRVFFGDTEKLKKLTHSYEKFSHPADAKQLYEAVAIVRKEPVQFMKYDEMLHVFGEPTWKTINPDYAYYRKSATSALRVPIEGGRSVTGEPQLVIIDEKSGKVRE